MLLRKYIKESAKIQIATCIYVIRVKKATWVRRVTKVKKVKLDLRERKVHLVVLDSLASG